MKCAELAAIIERQKKAVPGDGSCAFYPEIIRNDIPALIQWTSELEARLEVQVEKTQAALLQVEELQKIIREALPFMNSRHAWKPTAPCQDMIDAMEKALPGKPVGDGIPDRFWTDGCQLHHAVDCPDCVLKPKCPSVYMHTSFGRLECEKDGGHLHRVGDVEHQCGKLIWMSV
jgi:hypothetical protein